MAPDALRVLVVDDDKVHRWFLSCHLNREGYRVTSAGGGEQALRLLCQGPQQLMLLDLDVPDLDGLCTLRRARELRPGLQVLLMARQGSVPAALEGLQLGAAEFLVKPFDLQALDEALARAQAAGHFGPPSPAAEAGAPPPPTELVGISGAMAEVRETVARLAASDTTVLLQGESGTGKELVARCIHRSSSRASEPFLEVNCDAIPDDLLESELFGHEAGTFSEAPSQKVGFLEAAGGGTVLLDEIGELSPNGQAMVLRLLETMTFRRVGGRAEQRAEVRIIASTRVDLEHLVSAGRFRADLFYRLNVVRLRLTPLRERPQDLAPLSEHLLVRLNREHHRHVRGLSPEALSALLAYQWPRNCRELRDALEEAVLLHPDAELISAGSLPQEVRAPSGGVPHRPVSSADAERTAILEALEATHGNQSRAARLLGLSRDALRYRLKRLQLT